MFLTLLFRQDLQSVNDRLQRVLLEMLRVTIATEENIGRRLGACVAGEFPRDLTPNTKTRRSSRDPQETGFVIVLTLYLTFLRI